MKAILWDNDGVLVDTEELYYRATRELLSELDVPLSEADFALVSLRQGRSCFELASERGVAAERVEAARLRRNARYTALLRAGVAPIDGVTETLHALRGQARMAIVTSSRPEHFAQVHDRLDLRGHFELVLTGADYTRFKPDPQPYLLAAERLGLDPSECLVVEDSERGLVSATRAGMRCVVIPRGLSARGNYAGAFRVLERTRDLVPVVRELLGGSA